MKTKLNLLAIGIFLTAAVAGSGQSTVQFTATSYTAAESAGTVAVTVQRLNDTNPLVTVDYAAVDGTATNGLNYTSISGTLAFGAGETNSTILLTILNNGFVERTKNFQVILSNPTNAILGTRTNATVSITDNDVGVQFIFDTYSVAEDTGAVLLGVVRGDDGILPVTVDFATSDLTATNGLDYASTNNTLSFAPTERLKLVSVPILNDSLKEANKTFRATLSNPVGATLGSQKTITVTIVDNDPGFQFETNIYYVAEDAGVALIGVRRGTDATNDSVAVDVTTVNGSALSGLDYTGLTNTLTFAAGERLKVVTVPILNDGIKEATKLFSLTLSNPTGGAVLGAPRTTTVNVQDNDPGLGFEFTGYTNGWGQAADFSVTVLRGNDGALGPITVDYATSDLTAEAGTDYQAVSGTLAFQENETVKSLTIPLLRARAAEGTKSFRVTLSNPTGGATLGASSTTMKILGAYYTLSPPFGTALTIRRDSGRNILTWAGGGQLQKADNVTGPWQTLTAAKSPCTVQSPIPTTFYRVMCPRPVKLYVPSTYDAQTPVTLVILLHGYSDSGITTEDYLKFQPLAESRGFLYCYPDGMIDAIGNQGWNSVFENDTDASAARFYNVDDVAFLRDLIQEIGRQFALDRKRVYLIGHSNGGQMTYRLACESADLIAGIVSLAGLRPLDYGHCQPSEPVNVLHIHGTADAVYAYWGGAFTNPPWPWNSYAYPGVVLNLQNWAGYNGARDPVTDPGPSLNLDLAVAGLDSVITRYTTCPPGGAVELWTINGGSHVPTFYNGTSSSEFAPRVIDWLFARPKP
jgi:poly(3-hydroxybutyrate) depolymerase